MTRKYLWLVLCAAILCFAACQKAPELTITSPSSIELSADGSTGTITFTANRDWKASCSDSWVSVSPSSGTASDGPVTVTVRCNANTTYDDRTATVTIKMEELSQTVTVRQPANLGIVLPTQSFDLQSDSKTIELEVQANVQYTVSTSADWIKQTGTKGLTSTKLTFSIAENKTYDSREGKITIKPQQGNVQEQVVTVRQAQKDALNVEKTSYEMPYGGGGIEIKVEANVSFDVTPNVNWIHYVETKALSSSTIYLTVDENETYSAREGKIEISQKNGTLKHTVTVKQAGRIAVTSIELNKTELKLEEGASETLTATVKPDNATDKTVTWSSSDENVATIDASGKVTAIKKGSATITAQAGEKTAKCTVTVYKEIPVSSIELDKTSLSLVVGDEVTLNATVKPDDATDKTVTWSSSDSSIATVDANGKVTAMKEGTATITAKAGEAKATCIADISSNQNIVFADPSLKQCLVGKFDSNGDGELSYEEAAAVKDFSDAVTIKTAASFDEFRFFTGLQEIPLLCFASWTNLSSIILPPSISSIADKAFFECTNLSSLVIPGSVTSIGAWCFSNCKSLTSIAIPNGVKVLENNVFSNCSSLVSITIPNSVTKIDYNAFSNCSELKSITIPSGIECISSYVFMGCKSLSEIMIPISVTRIEDYAFGECSGLSEITIPNSVLTIGNGAFAGCTGLSTITIPNSITSISERSFNGCIGLSEITIPNSVESIGDSAFRGCTSLAEIAIPNSVTRIGNYAFGGCSSLSEVTTPNSAISIGNSAFKECKNLRSVTLQEGLEYIGESIFSGCERLTTISLPNSLKIISEDAFGLCISLSEIAIPNSVTEIRSSAFGYCTNLQSVVIQEGVTYIGSMAFSNCTKLSSITIPGSVSRIGNGAFAECNNLSFAKVLPTVPPTLEMNSGFNGEYPIYVPDSSVDTYTQSWSVYSGRIYPISAFNQ